MRHYTHCDIQLKVETIDALKNWNIHKPSIAQDQKFLRLLLLDMFTTNVLRNSSLKNLDAGKIRFARGSILSLVFDDIILVMKSEFGYRFIFFFVDVFRRRIGADAARASRFNALVNSYCTFLHNKAAAKKQNKEANSSSSCTKPSSA